MASNDVVGLFQAALENDARENNGVLCDWKLIDFDDSTIRISFGPGMGVLTLSTNEEGNVQLDFDNEENDDGEISRFIEDLVAKCADAVEVSPRIQLPGAIQLIFDLCGKEYKSPQADRAFAFNDDGDYDTFVYEDTSQSIYGTAEKGEGGSSFCSLFNDAEAEEIQLRSRLLAKAATAREAEEAATTLSKSPGKKVSSIFSEGAAAKILVSDLLSIMKDSISLGYTVEAIDDDIFNWRILINDIKRDSPLFADLNALEKKTNYRFIEVHLSFSVDLYPFFPPLVLLIRPRFQGFMLGRLASIKSIQLSSWDPVWGPREVVQNIIMELEQYGRIEVDSPLNSFENNPNGSYSALDHLLLKLCLVTEIRPRCHFKTSQLLPTDGYDEARRKRRQLFCSEGRGADSSGSAEVVWVSVPPPSISNNVPADSSIESREKKSPSSHGWAKGTGYGSAAEHDYLHHSGRQSEWNIEQYKAQQREKDRLQEEILLGILKQLTVIKEQLVAADSTSSGASSSSSSSDNASAKCQLVVDRLYTVLEESCIVPFLQQLLANESLVDMEEHSVLYNSCFQLLGLMTASPWMVGLFGPLEYQEITLRDSALQMHHRLRIFLKRTQRDSSTSGKGVVREKVAENEGKLDIDAISAVLEGIKALSIIHTSGASALFTHKAPVSELDLVSQYITALRPLQYLEVSEFRTFHYRHTDPDCGTQARIKRLAQEHSDLSASLPLSWSSSVWLSTLNSRMDLVQAMISGPEGTPYQNGLFLFDVYFPLGYPSEPPKVNLQTTGYGSVRFNPNLYKCGKVCLSLLGTWQGDAQEGWIKGTSTFLQVLVSIQSLIFVSEPYFNEPGYERSMGTAEGTRESMAYNSTIKLATVTHAMIDHIEKPKIGFEEVIKIHFLLKRDEIISQVDAWAKEVTSSSELLRLANKLKSLLNGLQLSPKIG